MLPEGGPRAAGPQEGPARRRTLVLMGEVFVDGGIQRFNRTFLAACSRLEVGCDVLSMNDDESRREHWTVPPSINIRGFNRNKFRFARAILAAALFGRYDIIVIGHVNLLTLTVAALTFRRIARARLLLIAHGIEVWTCIHGWRRRSMSAIDGILCVSSYTARMIRQQAPELAADRFVIFPNALGETWEEQFVGNIGSTGRFRSFLLSVTRLDRNDRYKGLVTALEAFAMLDTPDLHYVIAGRGDDRGFLESVARRLQVSERVHFVGGVSDGELARLYQDCAAFVLPSGKEGFGIVFLEAMYFGAPVIAAAAKGAVDVVQHESTGLLVEYGDVVALRQAMQRMLCDSELREKIRTLGRQTVSGEGRFTFHAYVRRLAGILMVPV